MKIYIVCGDSGSYSDYSTWSIKAYRDESEALAHVKAANQWMSDNKEKINNQEYSSKNPLVNPFDPESTFVSRDTEFEYMELDMLDTFVESEFIQHAINKSNAQPN